MEDRTTSVAQLLYSAAHAAPTRRAGSHVSVSVSTSVFPVARQISHLLDLEAQEYTGTGPIFVALGCVGASPPPAILVVTALIFLMETLTGDRTRLFIPCAFFLGDSRLPRSFLASAGTRERWRLRLKKAVMQLTPKGARVFAYGLRI